MSTIPEKLQSSKDGLDALLTYANGVTGQTDTNIGDAIKTLCDGFGGGSHVFRQAETDGDVIPNKYINASGSEVSYSGWKISKYYRLTGFAVFNRVNQYCALYDADKKRIRNLQAGYFNAGNGTYYFRYSGGNGNVDAFECYVADINVDIPEG